MTNSTIPELDCSNSWPMCIPNEVNGGTGVGVMRLYSVVQCVLGPNLTLPYFCIVGPEPMYSHALTSCVLVTSYY